MSIHKTSTLENRIHPRYKLTSDCTICLDEFNSVFGSLINISRGGACIMPTTESPAVFSNHTASLRLKTKINLEPLYIDTNCELVRISKNRIGLVFGSTGMSHVHKLIEHLESSSKVEQLT